MTTQFHNLNVAEVIRETKDSVSISFDLPKSLKEEYTYLAGQYLTLKVNIAGNEERRAYSLSSSPATDNKLTITTKRVEGGKVSNYLNDSISAGLSIDVMTPKGNFKMEPNANNKRHYMLFGGGSGITPLLSILKTAIAEEPNSRVSLFYANRDEESIIFKDTIEDILKEHPDRLIVRHILDNPSDVWEGLKGFATTGVIKDFVDDVKRPMDTLTYMCGPNAYMDIVESALTEIGFPKERIKREAFTATSKSADKPKISHDKKVGDINTQGVKIILNGTEHSFMVKPKENILEAATDNGIDPPYSCRSGICSTCRAKLKSGSVHMDEREGLTDAEIEDGYVLTCQAHPLSDDVILDFE